MFAEKMPGGFRAKLVLAIGLVALQDVQLGRLDNEVQEPLFAAHAAIAFEKAAGGSVNFKPDRSTMARSAEHEADYTTSCAGHLSVAPGVWQAAAVSSERTFASISRVQARITKLLEPALGAQPFWLKAELSSVNQKNGRLYCDLVELQQGRVVAKLRCTIWPRDLTEINRRLKAASLEELLVDGNEVGLKCSIQYHPMYGMSVTAVDIDPEQSLGALERKRQEIVERLRSDKLLRLNASKSVVALPAQIGLVASVGTAGYKDFVTTVCNSGYAMTLYAADARVEGNDSERSILRALQQLATLDLDVVIVLRGGGSRISLSYMDNEAIARVIASYPTAVWSAIGHEIDTSVVDAVAHTSFKTPTAVAEHLVARYVEAEEELRAAALRLRQAVQLRLQPLRDRVDGSLCLLQSASERLLVSQQLKNENNSERFRLLVNARLAAQDSQLHGFRRDLEHLALQRSAIAKRCLLESKKSLGKTMGRALHYRSQEQDTLRARLVAPTALNRLRSEEQRLRAWKQVLRGADPARNLERGYALAMSAEGHFLRGTAGVKPGDLVTVVLADGRLVSQVETVLAPQKVDVDHG